MLEDKSKYWSSVDLFSLYEGIGIGGPILSRKVLFSNILDYHGDKVIQLSSPGLANIMVFCEEAAKHFRLHANDSGDISDSIQKVAQQIKNKVSH